VIAVVVLTQLAAATAAPADDGEPGWRLEKVSRTTEVAPGTPVEISNPIGDIRVRSAHDQVVEVLANIQLEASGAEPPRVEIVEREGTLQIEVRPVAAVAGRLPRVDLPVFCPRNSDLDLHTAGGLAEAKGITGAVAVSSDRGDVVVSATGPISTRTVRGETSVTFLSADCEAPSGVHSTTGDITVRLAREADVVVEIDTIGTIATDFSIEITPAGQGERKRGRAAIGDGGCRLELTSERGRITLLRTWYD
jgi:hypothetical protein